MKKISTLVCAVLAGGFSFAQTSSVPMKDARQYNMRNALMNERTPVVADAQSNQNRVVLFSSDFSTPADWTMMNTSLPSCDFTIGTALTASLVSQGFGPTFNSTSGGNFALIDSDAKGGTATQDAYLVTTNSMDFSLETSVQMSFINYHRRYLETHYVVVSIDGGTTWTEIEVNGQYPTSTTSPNAELVTVNLTCIAAGQANVKVGFHYLGAWDWFWAIDDVQLTDSPADDVALVTTSYYSATQTVDGDNPRYTIFPANQAMPISHMATLQNYGANSATNAQLGINVLNPSNGSVYTGSSTTATLGTCSGTSADLTATTNYTPGVTAGMYKSIYGANYTNVLTDATPTNNVDTLYHWINSNLYAVDDNTYRGAGLWNGAGNSYEMGPLYMINTNVNLYSIDVALTGNTDAGVVMCAKLYEIDGTGAFVLVDETCGGADEITVTAGDISTGNTITWVHNVFATPVALTAGTEYIACVSHYGGADELVVMQGGTGADTTTIFLLDGTDATWYYMTSLPMVRMNFDASVGVNEINENSNLSLYQNVPNPANGTTRITFNLNENSDVTFELVDITGKVVLTSDLGQKNMGNHNMTIDVTPFASGVYYYSVTANGTKMTKKMVITE